MKFADGSELICGPLNFNQTLGVALIRRIEGNDAEVDTVALVTMPMPDDLRKALESASGISIGTVNADRVNGRLTGR